MKEVGVSQSVISTLDFVPSNELRDESPINISPVDYDKLLTQIKAVVKIGEHSGLNISYHLGFLSKVRPICTENVQRSFFVSADGTVSPCVFMNIPVSKAFYLNHGKEQLYQRLTFGNVNEQSMMDIWHQKDYASFRHSFDTGQFISQCQHCPKLYETVLVDKG